MHNIHTIPKELRPRERLILFGPSILEQYELLAILLGVGTKKEGVLDIAAKIFPIYAPATIEVNLPANDLARNLDIPLSHACKLIALFELHKRLLPTTQDIFIHTAHDVYKRYRYLKKYAKEHVIGIYLNARNAIIHEETISIGTVDKSLIGPKEALEPAIVKHAVGLVICHNHPSGDPTPSHADILSTHKLLSACILLDVKLFDHVIVGNNSFSSLREIITLA